MNCFKLYETMQTIVIISVLRGACVWGTTFTFVNKCGYTVWPGILAGASSPKLESTGFELPQGGAQTFQAQAGWSGRFWGRTGCNFSSSGQGSCSTGDCGSGTLQCNGNGATPPATLAEFTLNGSGGQDFYDVSLVDGYNLPMIVEATGGSGECSTTGCLVDLNLRCPSELAVAGGGACKSACEAFGDPQYCCSGEYASPDTCKPTQYSELFKSACPRAYSYAYDDASSTFTCSAADYTITFCPSTPSQKSSMGTTTPSNMGATGASGSGSSSSPGSGSLMADGSWLANFGSGVGPNTRHLSLALQLSLLFISIASLATSLF